MNLAFSSRNLKSADWLAAHQIHRFSHPAMATIFEIFLFHPDLKYAQQAVQTAFGELDRLEQDLSRFIENSDITRINRQAINESVKVGLDTFTCLQMCRQINGQTQGSFDITVGALVDFWRENTPAKKIIKKRDKIEKKSGMRYMSLDDKDYSVRILKKDLGIDLGGFGKGYALDRMADILTEWDITCAMLHSGQSTVLALAAPGDEKGWPLSLQHPHSGKLIKYLSLVHSAVSGSGVQKGAHIIDPQSGKPVKDKLAAWSTAPTAAVADALSTAFMIMPIQQIEKYILKYPETSACVIFRKESRIVSLGKM